MKKKRESKETGNIVNIRDRTNRKNNEEEWTIQRHWQQCEY
jgi:hypothetical protein